MDAVGGYELIGRVAESLSGALWKGWDPRLGRSVALKQVSASSVADVVRLRGEAMVLAALEHPNIVTVYEILDGGGQIWLVEEWVEGVLLSSVNADRFSPQQTVGVVRGALMGLAYVHERHLVHGDVSPVNILLDMDGASKLIDFGLAAPSGIAGLGGTPGYLSPEAARGMPVTERGDVYASGSVLAMLLRGRALFAGPTAEAVIARQLSGADPDLTGIPRELRIVLSRALSREPADRYADAGRFLSALEDAAADDFGPDWLTDAGVAAVVAGSATFSTLIAVQGAGTTAGHGAAAVSGHAAPATSTAGTTAVGQAPSAPELPDAPAEPQPTTTTAHRRPQSRRRSRLLRPRPLTVRAVGVVMAAAVVVVVVAVANHGGKQHPAALPASALGPTAPIAAQTSSATAGQLAPTSGPFAANAGSFRASADVAADTYYSASCPTATTCLAVGLDGHQQPIVSTSNDAGAHWTSAPSGTPAGLGLLECSSPSHCVAAMAAGVVDRFEVTADGGRTWQPATTPRLTDLESISCPTAQDCLTVGGETNTGGTPEAAASTDGGHIWHLVHMPGPANDVDCVDLTHCWASGAFGKVWRSSNLGVAWQAVSPPNGDMPVAGEPLGPFPANGGQQGQGLAFYVAGVAFSSDSEGFAFGGARCGGYHVTQCPSGLFRTSDAGQSWTFWSTSDESTYGDGSSATCTSIGCLLVADTFTHSVALTSPNGSSWTDRTTFAGFVGRPACTPSGTACVLVGTKGLFVTSS
ncbi:MAG: protein kinase [Jatrophihabitans sp.]